MKLKILSVLGTLFFILNCATVEPPKIENGRYFNSEEQFSIKVPDGWEYSETIPEFYPGFYEEFTDTFSKHFVAAFFDPTYLSFIIVATHKTKIDWTFYKWNTEILISHLEEGSEEARKSILEKLPICGDFRTTIYRDNIDNCINQCIAVKWSLQCGKGKDERERGKFVFYQIIYKSWNKRVYGAFLALLSREDKYVDSIKVFESVLYSFQPY